MTWWTDTARTAQSRERAEKAMSLGIGLASPLWLAFSGAASAGVAWWWMTRWVRPINIEASDMASPAPTPDPVEATAPLASAAEAPAEPVSGIEIVEAVEAAPTASEVPTAPDDLTVLAGIGPKLAEALAARGVTRFEQIAAWTDEDLKTFDVALSLKGRAVRDAWVDQAKRMADGA